MAEKTVEKLFDLKGKTCLITGASGYLGGAMARALAEAGGRVVVTSRELDRAVEIAVQLPDPNDVNHLGAVLDHMDVDGLPERFQTISEQAGCIDVLVNNGHEHCPNDWTDISGEQFTRMLANATGYFLLSRLVQQQAVDFGQPASIIMLGSMYGLVSSNPDAYRNICPANSVAYQTLKGGILQQTRHLAINWAEYGVRVNSLTPGPFPAESANPEMVERLKGYAPMRRMGNPAELKGAVVFLASEASSYMTGQNLIIDGGWTAV
jgi:gluconate 5-dehydrogenase